MIERNGEPVAAIIRYADDQALLGELGNLRAAQRAEEALV